MSRTFSECCLVLLVASVFATAVRAEDWPQWRGPNRTDVSSETRLLKKWPEGGPELVWLFRDAGLGYSGYSIVGDRLFTMGARDDVTKLICVNVQDGTEVWASNVGEVLGNGWGDGPRSTPTVDGQFVYALAGKGDLVCANVADGAIVWKINLLDFGGEIPNWGYTESVLVDGNLVICTPGGAKGTMLAVDKQTGEKVWQTEELTDTAHYSSPIVVQHQGVRQYIQLTEDHVFGVDPENGKVLWQAEWPGQTAVIPTPIYHDGHVYITSGYGVGCNLFKIDGGKAEGVYGEEAKKVMKNHHGGVVLIDGHIYGHSDRTGWVCQNLKTGEMVWREREALGKGAVSAADGMLYCISEDEGHVVLANATPEGWQEVSRFTLEPQTELRNPRGRIWTHPVISNGKLYLRDQELLFCFDIKQK